MKIQLASKAFAKALTEVQSSISTKSTIFALENILMNCDSTGCFYLTGGSADRMATVPLEASVIEGKFSPILLPLSVIPKISGLSSPTITLSFTEGNNGSGNMKVEFFGGDFSIAVAGGKEYPVMNFDATIPEGRQECLSMRIPVKTFRSIIKSASPFCASDELRLVMNGICFDVSFGGCTFVGTNGHALFKYSYEPSQDKELMEGVMFSNFTEGDQYIFDVSHVKPLLTILNRVEDDKIILVEFGSNSIRFSVDQRMFVCRRTEGRFPNYNAVIPKNGDKSVTVGRIELANRLRYISLFSSSSTNLIALTFKPEDLTLEAKDVDFGIRGKDTIAVQEANNIPAAGVKIGINAGRAIDAFNALPGAEATIVFTSPDRPVVVRPSDPSSPVTTLLMPMLIND